MKTQKNILIAFVLNLAFAVFELFGGIFTGSVAVLSDAVHDLGDAISIGISFFLEKKSRKQPDAIYTFGYGRFSVLGGVITTLILLLGSVLVIGNAVNRLIRPVPIHYDGMILFAVVGVAVNFLAAWITREGDSINQKAVNLHMLEDVLGWVVVLVGAVVMRFTDFTYLDPIMSIGVALFILINAAKNLYAAGKLFLQRAPEKVTAEQIKEALTAIDAIEDVHHIHLWSMNGQNVYATMHLVTDADPALIKYTVRHCLQAMGVEHATLELERPEEHCCSYQCAVEIEQNHHCCHHHHHH